MEEYSFEKLEAYRKARKLVVEVYEIIRMLPNNEKFALIPQLQRAIISVPSNIAEGSGRISIKEKTHFLEIAFGSLMEAYCQLEICRDLNYISEQDLFSIKKEFLNVSRLINGLRSKFVQNLQQR